MKNIIPNLLAFTAISGLTITPQFPSAFSLAVSKRIAMPTSRTTDFTRQPPIGELGQPLGKVTTIAGVIRQAALGAKSSNLDLVLSIEAVNDRPLPKPVTMPFQTFATANVAKSFLGQTFRYVGYETGGFSGVPAEAFKWVPAVSSADYHFATVYIILQEDLAKVKTKADLMRSNNRRVQIIGKYVAVPKQRPTSANANVVDPITNKPIVQSSYATVNIELADGTLVPLFSTRNKLSQRPSQEVKDFDGKRVRIVGALANEPNSTRVNSESKITVVRMDQIELDLAR
jgi:hypothetical protein